MKKWIAFLLAVLLLTLTACGGREDDTTQGSTTTTTTTTTTVGAGGADGTTTTTVGGTSATTTATTISGSATTTVTTTVPTGTPGVTVPIGTKPPVTTTTTVGGTTSSTQGGGTTSATTTGSTTTAPTAPTAPQKYITLPAVGSDIDVTKQKDRIRVSAATAAFNADGTIHVSLTFKNYSRNWITEETDYVEYTCYDKDGNVVQKATRLSIGVIDTKKNVEKTFAFDVPAATAEVKITKSKIVYWTEWA